MTERNTVRSIGNSGKPQTCCRECRNARKRKPQVVLVRANGDNPNLPPIRRKRLP